MRFVEGKITERIEQRPSDTEKIVLTGIAFAFFVIILQISSRVTSMGSFREGDPMVALSECHVFDLSLISCEKRIFG